MPRVPKRTKVNPRPPAVVTILIEIQDKKVFLWIDTLLLGEWNAKYTAPSGKPLEIARYIESAFVAVHVPSRIEFGEGLEELKELV